MPEEPSITKWTAGDLFPEMIIRSLYKIQGLYQWHYTDRTQNNFGFLDSEIQILWATVKPRVSAAPNTSGIVTALNDSLTQFSSLLSEFYARLESGNKDAEVIHSQILGKIQEIYGKLIEGIDKTGILVMTMPSRRYQYGGTPGAAPENLFGGGN